MTDYKKFNPAEFDELQKKNQTRGSIISLAVFSVLSAVNSVLSDFVHWTSGIGAIALFSGISMLVYTIYTAKKDSLYPVNQKDLNTAKIMLVTGFIILAGVCGGFLPEIIEGRLADNLNEDGSIRTSAMMLAGSGLYCIGTIISYCIYSRHRAEEKNEDEDE